MDAGRDDYLDEVLIGRRELAHIVLVDYDSGWPARFEALADVVRRSLVPRALSE